MRFQSQIVIPSAIGLVALMALPGDLRAEDSLDLSRIDTACLLTELDSCKVLNAGFFNRMDYANDEAPPLIAWQIQYGTSEIEGTIGGFVLLKHDGKDWSTLETGFDGFFSVPQLNADNLLHVPGYAQGTGVFNMDRLYRLEEDNTTWTPIDMDHWLEGVELPEELEIWKGVAFDFSNWSGYTARSSLWRPEDANCCPSGGEALISLEIEDNKLVGKDVEYTPPTEDAG